MKSAKLFSIAGIVVLLGFKLVFAQIIDDPIFTMQNLSLRKAIVENVEYDLVDLTGCLSKTDQIGAPYLHWSKHEIASPPNEAAVRNDNILLCHHESCPELACPPLEGFTDYFRV